MINNLNIGKDKKGGLSAMNYSNNHSRLNVMCFNIYPRSMKELDVYELRDQSITYEQD